jgi:hypothetical protein
MELEIKQKQTKGRKSTAKTKDLTKDNCGAILRPSVSVGRRMPRGNEPACLFEHARPGALSA